MTAVQKVHWFGMTTSVADPESQWEFEENGCKGSLRSDMNALSSPGECCLTNDQPLPGTLTS